MADDAFKGPSGTFDRSYFTQLLRSNGYDENHYVADRKNVAVRQQIGQALVGGSAAPAVYVDAYKEFNGDLECPTGSLCQLYAESQGRADCPEEMAEYDTAPRESLTVFVLLFLLQSIDVIRSGRRGGLGMSAWLGVVILGGLFTYGLMMSVENHRDTPKAPKKPIEGCRKPLPPVQPAGGPGAGNK